jgi:hypothetical protein
MIRLDFLRPLAAAALLAAAPGQLRAAPATTNANAGAVVLKPLTLLKLEDLDFGALFPAATAGTATLNPNSGTVTTAGGVTLGPGPTRPARFTGAGTRNAPMIIRLPKDPITLTRVGGTETMTVSNWTTDGPTTRQIDAFEAFEFRVGGRLNVGANQADGIYVGSFDVTVIYP